MPAGSTTASWYLNEGLEGSRFVGEGGHFIDTLGWWLGAMPVACARRRGRQRRRRPRDTRIRRRLDRHHQLPDLEQPEGPEGSLRRFGRGPSARLDNFRTASVWSRRRRHTDRSPIKVDKGQRAELDAFVSVLRDGRPMPIALPSLAATTRATLAIARSLATGQSEEW